MTTKAFNRMCWKLLSKETEVSRHRTQDSGNHK